MKGLCALILAAGKGTRMVSRRAKVLHEVCGIPMLRMVYQAAAGLQPECILVVVGHDADNARGSLENLPAKFVFQEVQLGTGHAVMAAKRELQALKGDLLVLSGDTPRIKPSTLNALLEHHRKTRATSTILTTSPPDPTGYGRIIRGDGGGVLAIVEQKDASPDERRIQEVNAGVYCFRVPALLSALKKLSVANAQGEYYLTDVISIQRRSGEHVEGLLYADFEELQGINTRRELALAAKAIWRDCAAQAMTSGVTLIDPEAVFISPGTRIENDAIIYPNVFLEGSTIVERGAIVRAGCRILDSRIGADAEIREGSIISHSSVGKESSIGPYAHLRDRTTIGNKCRIGNFVEVTRSTMGDASTAAHLAYLGDALIGNRVAIGAGTITCNFDGTRKHSTVIEDDAFIGTDSQLVAPVRIGRGALVAAGSCITLDVPAGALALARSRQITKKGWMRRRMRGLAAKNPAVKH